MKEIDEEYYALKSQRGNNENRQRSVQSNISSIDAKIDALKKAYRAIDCDKERLKGYRNQIGILSDIYGNVLKGQYSNNILSSCDGGSLYKNFDSYVKEIDKIQDDINWEINKLKNERNEQNNILGSLRAAWNNLNTRIRNYFN